MAEDSQVAYSNGYENGKSASAAELSRLQAEIAEARELVRILADMEPSSLVEPGSDDDRYTLHLSEKRQAHDVHGDQIRRARAFLEKADG